jgi:hypothetical protein
MRDRKAIRTLASIATLHEGGIFTESDPGKLQKNILQHAVTIFRDTDTPEIPQFTVELLKDALDIDPTNTGLFTGQ